MAKKQEVNWSEMIVAFAVGMAIFFVITYIPVYQEQPKLHDCLRAAAVCNISSINNQPCDCDSTCGCEDVSLGTCCAEECTCEGLTIPPQYNTESSAEAFCIGQPGCDQSETCYPFFNGQMYTHCSCYTIDFNNPN